MGKGKFDGVLLVSDFDDTLYGSQLHVLEKDRSAILSFIDQGGLFTVATGRARKTFSPQVVKENIPLNAPAILSNGATVFDYQTDQLVRRTYLPARVIQDMVNVCKAFPQLGLEAYYQNEIYVYNPNIITTKHMERVGMDYSILPLEEMPMPLTKMILQQSGDTLLQVQDYMKKMVGDSYEIVFSNRVLLELTAKGSHKGGSTRWLAHHLGIHPEHLYCVGDNQNDLPMLKAAKIGFAPENCTRELRQWGAHIVKSCDDGCVSNVIEILDSLY